MNFRNSTPGVGPVILYAEDEESDVLLLRMAFDMAGVSCRIISVPDGQKTIQYLEGSGCFSDRQQYPLPSLVLLDLNLPRENGFEVLAWIRQRPGLMALPVVVYTSSFHAVDRDKANALGASDYLLKRSDLKEIATLANELAHRWLQGTQS